ncbi:RraA family protein [Rhodohalobacter sp. 8-1]|uniref:RraA family protein n=1 Tax=Rhodohalobacter sp. 8-1 TaxID=3131972 RepID=UPI0030EC7970
MNISKSLFFSLLATILLGFLFFETGNAQSQLVPEEQVIFYTLEWEGDRDEYGRPLVSDQVLERMKFVGLEEAWGTIRGDDYHDKFEGNWDVLYPEEVMVGRALTATYMPKSPGLDQRMHEIGREADLGGGMNQYPIYMLEQGDVYVADGFGKIVDGTLIGDNLAQGIYSASGNGPILYGGARDMGGIKDIEGFNTWVKGWDPSFIQNMTLMSINAPTRIGRAIVLPGDVVLATETGVLFIPPHLAERVLLSSEVGRMVDTFRKQRIDEGVYTLNQTYGTDWTDAMNEDFYDWVGSNRTRLHEELGVGESTLNRVIETRSRNWQKWIED